MQYSARPSGSYKRDLPAALRAVRALMRKGHRVRYADGSFGGYQAIGVDPKTGVYAGASEGRKDGQAAGY